MAALLTLGVARVLRSQRDTKERVEVALEHGGGAVGVEGGGRGKPLERARRQLSVALAAKRVFFWGKLAPACVAHGTLTFLQSQAPQRTFAGRCASGFQS